MERPKRTGVMLAVTADERKIASLGDWFYIQPKLNGERARVKQFADVHIILSSYANVIPYLGQIHRELSYLNKKYDQIIPLDGELYVHGWERERIDSAIRTRKVEHSDNKLVEFHVFDIKWPVPQGERIAIYQDILNDPELQYIKPVPTFKADKHGWMTFADHFLDLGYEGAIMRRWNYPTYEARRLTGQMLKYKPTEFDEYTILGVTEAISQEGEPKEMVGAFIVMGDLGEFSVGAGKLDHKEREYWWQNKEKARFKRLKVKQGKILTSGGVPTCAVAVEVL